MAQVEITIKGLNELIEQCQTRSFLREPMHNFFSRAALVVENKAKQRAPVDTGRLRSSLTHEVDKSPLPLWAKVGTNVFYGPMMEFGTAAAGDGPGGKSRHFPPPAALDRWAVRHGIATGFLVARAIAQRGGLKPRRYLRGGLEDSLPAIQSLLDKAAGEIEAAWGRGR